VELLIDAAPQAVYALISDVTRVGERSPECRSASWEAGEPGTEGALFRGHNKVGRLARWSRRCEVVRADPGVAFVFRTLPERWDLSRQDSTTWSYLLEPVGAATRVQHSYRITRLPRLPFRAIFGRLIPDHRDMRPQMRHNLEALADQVRPAATT
jgi:hypothetical protein